MRANRGRVAIHVTLAASALVAGLPAAFAIQVHRELPREFWAPEPAPDNWGGLVEAFDTLRDELPNGQIEPPHVYEHAFNSEFAYLGPQGLQRTQWFCELQPWFVGRELSQSQIWATTFPPTAGMRMLVRPFSSPAWGEYRGVEVRRTSSGCRWVKFEWARALE